MTGRILILSLYYPPDLSACAFRTSALVAALAEAAPELNIDVLTSLPNRYHSFSSAAEGFERHGNVTIRRLPIPAHRSDMVTQAAAYARFAWRAAGSAKQHRYDLVFATSSRLMTAALGAWVSRRAGSPLYLDIRDLFADTMADILPPKVAMVVAPASSLAERWTMRRASHINLVSAGFESYFLQRYPTVPLSFFTNGIDDEFLLPVKPVPERASPPMTVVYAGNMGEGQGLHLIVPQLASRLGHEVRFRLIGDGGRRGQLVAELERAGVRNVEVLPPMPRARLLDEYLAADVLFLHLNAHQAFTRVLPSKIFEYAALGKPIWAGVAGHAAQFLRTEVRNAAVFPPCDADAAARAWNDLSIRSDAREEFVAKFARRSIMKAYASDILRMMRSVTP
jgi:glycosyltransferase involved in cell wall biosynthesis